ncbi:uncharacterized protein TEOVI_000744400 [Trypanosoma equiperdum]|uniref:Trypanosome variant surface glycoprotein (A-type) n=1 Tax=Trypanosoma equiperdum TaxID=5694 RepID=A0A1G4IAU3_TRYEQ|nr:hypothetical protein TEOVI_000744400 [Trypanosoma equiperdum]
MRYISPLIFALTFQPSASALHSYGKQVKKPCDSKYYLENMAEKANQNVEQALTSTRTALLQAAKQALVGSAESDPEQKLAANIALATNLQSAYDSLDRIIVNWNQLQAGLAAIHQLAATNALVAEVAQATLTHVAAVNPGTSPAPEKLRRQ